MTIFAFWQTMSRVRKHPYVCAVTWGETDFISIVRVCFLQWSQDWGVLPFTGAATVPEDLPRPSQFSCAFVGSFPLISCPSCMASFFLLPPPSSMLLHLTDPSSETLASSLGVPLGAPSLPQNNLYQSLAESLKEIVEIILLFIWISASNSVLLTHIE